MSKHCKTSYKSCFFLTEIKVRGDDCNFLYNVQETDSVAEYLLSIASVFRVKLSDTQNKVLEDHISDVILPQQL